MLSSPNVLLMLFIIRRTEKTLKALRLQADLLIFNIKFNLTDTLQFSEVEDQPINKNMSDPLRVEMIFSFEIWNPENLINTIHIAHEVVSTMNCT